MKGKAGPSDRGIKKNDDRKLQKHRGLKEAVERMWKVRAKDGPAGRGGWSWKSGSKQLGAA